MHKLALVIPCFNEAEIIDITIDRLIKLCRDLIESRLIHEDSFILLIDDGSKDNTWNKIESHSSGYVKALKLAANTGHQHALLAGLHYATNRVDFCISLDADLQDDISAIKTMILQYKGGSEIVYGVRKRRETDSFIKRHTALFFYKLMQWIGINILYNHADFRLLSNKVLNAFKGFKEVNLFLRGIFPMMGFPSSIVYYDRLDRIGGKSKYPFFKMLRLAIDGITSFSNAPLRIITVMGLFVFLASIGASAWAVLQLIRGNTVPGWTSISLPLYFLGGIQLLAIGILGEYISKIYLETKRRPHYIVEKIMSAMNEKDFPVSTKKSKSQAYLQTDILV